MREENQDLVKIGKEGRVTLPARARREVGLEGGGQAILEVSGGRITLIPAEVLSKEDAWAYTPAHRAELEAAHEQLAAGDRLTLSEDDLRSLFAARTDIVARRLELEIVEARDDSGRSVKRLIIGPPGGPKSLPRFLGSASADLDVAPKPRP